MRLYTPVALAGLVLILTQPVPRAQDSKAEQERAVAQIKKLGGKVEVDRERPDAPVVGVDLSHAKVIDASLEHLKGLTTVERLLLRDTTVTDDGMVYLRGLTDLEALELGRTKVTDKGLGRLKGLTRLETLGLENATAISDAGLPHLKGLARLRKLDLRGTGVTDAGARDLQKALPKVKIVR